MSRLLTPQTDAASYVEKRMVDDGVDELDLEVLAPIGNTKRVAALAFVSERRRYVNADTFRTQYNCLSELVSRTCLGLTVLALTTKGILGVSQPEAWGSISLRFTVQV